MQSVVQRSFVQRAQDVDRQWLLLDAEGAILGRMAAQIATILRGKHKPSYTPHIDCGDHVIVINAEKVALSGTKRTDKTYFWHTGHPGGIKSRTAEQLLDGRFPERVVELAVRRMLPSGPLARAQFRKLRVYAGPDHPHAAQKPQIYDFSVRSAKNHVGFTTMKDAAFVDKIRNIVREENKPIVDKLSKFGQSLNDISNELSKLRSSFEDSAKKEIKGQKEIEKNTSEEVSISGEILAQLKLLNDQIKSKP